MEYIVTEKPKELDIKKDIKRIFFNSLILSFIVLSLFSFVHIYGLIKGYTEFITHLEVFIVLLPFHLFWQFKALSPLRDKNILITKEDNYIVVNKLKFPLNSSFILKVNLGNYRSTNKYRIYLESNEKKVLIVHSLNYDEVDDLLGKLKSFLNLPIRTVEVGIIDSLI